MIRELCDYCGNIVGDGDPLNGPQTLGGKHGPVVCTVTLSDGVCPACRVAAMTGAVSALHKRHAPKTRLVRSTKTKVRPDTPVATKTRARKR